MPNGSGATQCPKCGAVGTYKITMQNGGQVISCNSCRKNFTAEVKQGVFTGRNR
jgi:transcription elongation factor Elf1